MGFRWNCLESLTGIGIGVASIGAATFLPGAEIGVASAATGAVIGGAGLLARIKENGRKAGLEDETLITRMQARLLRDLEHWDQRAEREAAQRADAAMTRFLPQVMLSRQELAATALECRGAEDRYPAIAAQRVVDELARHDDLFRAAPAGLPESFERQFAREAVTAALLAAKEDPQYAALMTLDVTIELGAAIRETIDAVQSLRDKVERGFAALQDRAQSDDAKLARLSEKAMRGAIARFIAFSPRAGTDEIVEAVEQFAEDYDALLGRVRELDAHDNRVRGLQRAAEEALAEGDLDEARRLLREASDVRVDAATAAVREAAETLSRLAETDLLALDWESAAANWERAAAMLAPFDGFEQARLLANAGAALAAFSRTRGGLALDRALEIYRLAVSLAERDKDKTIWAKVQNDLGISLQVKAARIGGAQGNELLDEAVRVHRLALTVLTRETYPIDWALIVTCLGEALKKKGEWIGSAAGIQLLEEAAEAHRLALQVRTQRAMPIEWAATQHNLGLVLASHGELLGAEVGHSHLQEAVQAFRSALLVRTREAFPTSWAMTLNNLANALVTMGEFTGGEEGERLICEAIKAYSSSLEVQTRDSMPLQWAMVQNNLGSAFEARASRYDGAVGRDFLNQAIAHYRLSLLVRKSAHYPLAWARTLENIASVHYRMARIEKQNPCKHYFEARECLRLALGIFSRDHMPFNFEKASRLFETIETAIAEHCPATP
ncbi:hypothetical protein [Erythrobacter sp. WG]|uniref:hypothetical protein n=1 Tax=Erythrobacter sp. WG TaxID=2985510 RepID=UPI002270CDF9|nr:hypothetical protein [Erythrobacter sp. WG]MCX9148880.1 hypothetical protein [Erythrobacter sp. WG]